MRICYIQKVFMALYSAEKALSRISEEQHRLNDESNVQGYVNFLASLFKIGVYLASTNNEDAASQKNWLRSRLLEAASDVTVDFRQLLLAVPATNKLVSKEDSKTELRGVLLDHLEQVLNCLFPAALISMAGELQKRRGGFAKRLGARKRTI